MRCASSRSTENHSRSTEMTFYCPLLRGGYGDGRQERSGGDADGQAGSLVGVGDRLGIGAVGGCGWGVGVLGGGWGRRGVQGRVCAWEGEITDNVKG